MCVRPIITYGHQIWAAAAKSHISKIRRIQNKFLRIILDKPYDTPIRVLHEIANIQTIQDYIANSLKTAYHTEHQNPLISQTGNYINNILLKIKKKLPKHAIATL